MKNFAQKRLFNRLVAIFLTKLFYTIMHTVIVNIFIKFSSREAMALLMFNRLRKEESNAV